MQAVIAKFWFFYMAAAAILDFWKHNPTLLHTTNGSHVRSNLYDDDFRPQNMTAKTMQQNNSCGFNASLYLAQF